MRIGIVAFGSDGDIQPHVELAIALAKSNHEIQIFIISIRNRDYSSLNNIKGITLIQNEFPTHIMNEEFTDTQFWDFEDSQFHNFFDRQYKIVRNQFRRYSKKLVKANDIVIGNRQAYPLRFSAEAQGIPYISLSFEHTFIKSKYYPPLTIKDGTYEENFKAWEDAEKFANLMYLPELNEYRNLYKLPPTDDYYNKVVFSNKLNLVSFSKYLLEDEIDWERHHHICGYFNAKDKNIDWQIPESLSHFINAGPPPVFITLGSLTEYENNKKGFNNLLISAVKKANSRAIILSNFIDDTIEDKDIFYLNGFVDYSQIVPKCQLVIHHGGVGTMHCVAALGIPSLILAYGFDQFNNAKLLINKKVCNTVIARKELTTNNLAAGIQKSIKDNTLYSNAQILGNRIQKEDGLTEAVNKIEEMFCEVIDEPLINS